MSNSQINAQQPTRNESRPNGSRQDDNAGGEVPRRPKGRPRGSKNKPKSPVDVIRETGPDIKLHVLEISAGCDVIEALIGFACRLNVSITVLSGLGNISSATIYNPLPPGTTYSVDRPMSLLSLSGSFVTPSAQPSTWRTSVSSGPHPRSTFTVSISGIDGQVFGGIVAGSLVAASNVTVYLFTFVNPVSYTLPSEAENDNSTSAPLSTYAS